MVKCLTETTVNHPADNVVKHINSIPHLTHPLTRQAVPKHNACTEHQALQCRY